MHMGGTYGSEAHNDTIQMHMYVWGDCMYAHAEAAAAFFFPRVFFSGADFFSFCDAMTAEMRARVACRERSLAYIHSTAHNAQDRTETKAEKKDRAKNVSAKESGASRDQRTNLCERRPDSDMARARRGV